MYHFFEKVSLRGSKEKVTLLILG